MSHWKEFPCRNNRISEINCFPKKYIIALLQINTEKKNKSYKNNFNLRLIVN